MGGRSLGVSGTSFNFEKRNPSNDKKDKLKVDDMVNVSLKISFSFMISCELYS